MLSRGAVTYARLPPASAEIQYRRIEHVSNVRVNRLRLVDLSVHLRESKSSLYL